MKKRISLLVMSLLMVLNITSIYAVDEPQYCVYKINEQSIKDEKVILDKAAIDSYIKQQDSSYTYEDIKIVNELPYDIQLENTSLCIPSLGEFYFASLLFNANTLSTDKVYTYDDVFSYYQDLLIFNKTPIHGYVFLDSQSNGMFLEESQRIAGMSIDLWQANNLVETVLTDDKGYYQFKQYDNSLPYTITIQNNEDYIPTKYNDNPLANHFQLSQDQKMSLTVQENTHQNIGLLKKIYAIQYLVGDKIIQKQYHYQDEVSLYQENISKDGYTFIEWNSKQDGSGQSYKINTIIKMPKNNIILYPIYQQVKPIETKVVNEEVVSTGDETHVMLLWLLLLGSLTGIIVSKVLKKNKNR